MDLLKDIYRLEGAMAEKRIVDAFDIKSRFLRSAHLERDFNDSAALSGYVRTDFIESAATASARASGPSQAAGRGA